MTDELKTETKLSSNKLNELLNEYEIYQKTHNLDEARIVYMTKDELLKLNPDIKNKITN